jgi:hypothetical protein
LTAINTCAENENLNIEGRHDCQCGSEQQLNAAADPTGLISAAATSLFLNCRAKKI